MTKDEELIDEIDLALFRILRRAHDLPAGAKCSQLIVAIRYARSLSEALLPEAKRESFQSARDATK